MARKNGNRGSSGKKKIEMEFTQTTLVLRMVCVGIAIVIASAAFYTVFTQVLHTQGGWETIDADDAETAAVDDFEFLYQLGVSGTSASTEWAKLTKLYPQYLDQADQAFSTVEYEDVGNLYTLNQHPNESVTVEPALYSALELLAGLDSRYLYYAPVFQQYHALFACSNDWETESFDPAQNDQVYAYVQQVIAYAGDPDSIDLELLGDNSVRLTVSQDYLDFAQENEITAYLDFFYLRNAFILDYVADQLIADGYTAGLITSVEGFSRALGADAYSVNLYDLRGSTIYQAAVLEYTGPKSMVFMRNYPLNSTDSSYYYVMDSGEIRTPYLDLETGLCASAMSGLLVYADSMGCAELLLRSWDTFVLGSPTVEQLQTQGIDTVYFEGETILASDPAAAISAPSEES